MKTTLIALIFSFWTNTSPNPVARAQQTDSLTRKELEKVLYDFMNSIKERDSAKFYGLFYDGPVTWVGVDKEKSYQSYVKKNPKVNKNYFKSSPQSFIRSIVAEGGGEEEKFYNIRLDGDERMATVTFDYSYWSKGKKQNWGEESWALIRANGQWKITSVIFSVEMEAVVPEPNRQAKKKP